VSRTLAILGVGAIGVAWLVGRKPRGDVAHDDVDALARVITSEADRYSEVERTAIAWAVRNRARKRGASIAKVVCSPTCGPCCHGRPFSSARPATAVNRELAERVLAAPQSDDPTGGATSFFEPRVQDKLVAAGHEGYRFTSVQLRDKWKREGQSTRATVGAFEFWA
jgi:spore germination cell wall hydrolase CwlJ-like protein